MAAARSGQPDALGRDLPQHDRPARHGRLPGACDALPEYSGNARRGPQQPLSAGPGRPGGAPPSNGMGTGREGMKNGFENARRRSLPPQGVAEFKQAFGARFVTSDAVRAHHGRDESPYPACLPDAVVFPRDADEVAHAVRLCDRYRVPVIPFGAGSSLEGHVLPIEGGITLSMAEMNRIISLQPEDFTATVQPGVTRTQVNDALRDTGLFFPIDPGADASIGGMAATRASGTNAVRYGTMRENVVSLKVVTAKGEIIRTGSRARKSSAGYDLTRLFVGSEGTLGIIVEVTLRIHPRPEDVTAAVCNFPTLADAVQSVVEIMQTGVGIARI